MTICLNAKVTIMKGPIKGSGRAFFRFIQSWSTLNGLMRTDTHSHTLRIPPEVLGPLLYFTAKVLFGDDGVTINPNSPHNHVQGQQIKWGAAKATTK